MAISVGQEFIFTVRFDPESQPVAKNDSGAWVVTPAKQTTGSSASANWGFNGFVKIAGGLSGDVGTSEGITQTFTVRVTSDDVTLTAEA